VWHFKKQSIHGCNQALHFKKCLVSFIVLNYTQWVPTLYLLDITRILKKIKLMSISTLNSGEVPKGSSKSKCPLAPFQAGAYLQNSINKHPLPPPWAATNFPSPYPTLDIYRSWGSGKDTMSTILRLLCRNERDSYLKIGIRSLWVVNSRCKIPHTFVGEISTYGEGSPK
jgi:hypothetical protein